MPRVRPVPTFQVKVFEDVTNVGPATEAAKPAPGGLAIDDDEAQEMLVADFLRLKRDEEVCVGGSVAADELKSGFWGVDSFFPGRL